MYLKRVDRHVIDLIIPTIRRSSRQSGDRADNESIVPLSKANLKKQGKFRTNGSVTAPGLGDLTASILLAEIGDVSDYDNARQLAAYAGLTPCERSSGTSVKGKTRLSCTGNVRLRKALYLPAVVAMRHNPLLKAMSDRLLGRGKVKMQVIGALMRKLVHLAFGILKSQKPFDPNYLTATP
ncbi:transposase [Microcoleus sp. EPA2]|uniref:transposase n=1 Tax=Microcoleus sp. EPA2 TaxID=2841654 RepID=UPI00312B7798